MGHDETRMDEAGKKPSLGEELVAVVPCYNAGARVAPVVEGLKAVLNHVIVVDDGSTDHAVDGLSQFGAQVVEFPENRGKGFAMIAGFRAALNVEGMAAAVIVDADGQHNPAELPRLYCAFRDEQADLVIGSRAFDESHVPWRSRFGNKLTAGLTGMLLGQRIVDTQSGYRLHSRRLLEFIVERVPGGRYETEMEILVKTVRGGFKVVPVPIQTIYEEGNPSSHFNKLRDSFRIYRKLFAAALRR